MCCHSVSLQPSVSCHGTRVTTWALLCLHRSLVQVKTGFRICAGCSSPARQIQAATARIEVVDTHSFLARLHNKQALREVGLVILDDFEQRSAQV